MSSVKYIYHMQELTKSYPGGKKCFENIHLSFLPGVKIGVVGVNGAGKSSLMKIMAGIDKDYTGEAWAAENINVGYLLLMVGTLYMGVYEWMHLSFHTPKDHWVNGIPAISWMRCHHTIHHQKAIMTKVNFNIVFPLSDIIFKSFRKSLLTNNHK